MMKCEEAEANLSLYVAGDIERPGERERIAAHLEGCEACRALASGWEASQRLLRLHEPPEFDAAFFDAVRRDVLSRISEPPPPSLFARLLGQPFGRRTLTYAAAFSLLVCAVIVTSHFRRRAHTPPVEVARKDEGGPRKTETGRTERPGPRAHEGGTKGDDDIAPRPRPNPTPRRVVRQADAAPKRAARRAEKSAAPPESRDTGEAARASNDGGVNNVPPGPEPKVAGSPKRVETAAVSRIELQTSDPNIRIIWLSPQRATDSAPPSKPNR
jgi:hypothetical protein